MDQFTRKARLTTFHHALAADETQQVEQEIDDYLERRDVSAERGTSECMVLARQLMRSEIEALKHG